MNAAPPNWAQGLRIAIAVAGCAMFGGCLAYTVVSAPVKVAVGTAEVAGTVAVGTVKAVGTVAGGAIKLAAGLAKAGAVTFVDVANNNQVTRVPYRKGLTLLGASETANVRLTEQAVDVVRDGKVVFSGASGVEKNTAVASGDVVQVGK